MDIEDFLLHFYNVAHSFALNESEVSIGKLLVLYGVGFRIVLNSISRTICPNSFLLGQHFRVEGKCEPVPGQLPDQPWTLLLWIQRSGICVGGHQCFHRRYGFNEKETHVPILYSLLNTQDTDKNQAEDHSSLHQQPRQTWLSPR